MLPSVTSLPAEKLSLLTTEMAWGVLPSNCTEDEALLPPVWQNWVGCPFIEMPISAICSIEPISNAYPELSAPQTGPVIVEPASRWNGLATPSQ